MQSPLLPFQYLESAKHMLQAMRNAEAAMVRRHENDVTRMQDEASGMTKHFNETQRWTLFVAATYALVACAQALEGQTAVMEQQVIDIDDLGGDHLNGHAPPEEGGA